MAGKTLWAISILLTVLTLLVFSTIAYSAYADTSEVIGIAGNASSAPAVTVATTYEGSTALVLVNITLHNAGLYPMDFAASCVPTPGGLNATCGAPNTVIAPGTTSTIHLTLSVNGVSQQNGTAGKPVDANFTVALLPFVSLQVSADLSGLIGGSGQ